MIFLRYEYFDSLSCIGSCSNLAFLYQENSFNSRSFYFTFHVFRLSTLHSLLEDRLELPRVVVSAQIAPVLLK